MDNIIKTKMNYLIKILIEEINSPKILGQKITYNKLLFL
jgi:hypothetical protein